MFGFIHVLLVFLVLLGVNEASRRSKWFVAVIFLVIPVVLTPTVWMQTGTTEGSSINTWFHWAKVYSVLIAVLGFTAFRFTKLENVKFMKFFPALILGVNIFEAVIRDFELGAATPGHFWHFLNGIAGIISIITITGWSGVHVDKSDKIRDMIWPDQQTLWIIPYGIWNISYVYFCVPEHAGYAIAANGAATVAALFIKKGTWIQARAFTLGLWMIYLFTFPTFIDNPANTFFLPESTAIHVIFGIVSFVANVYLLVIIYGKVRKIKGYKLGQEVL